MEKQNDIYFYGSKGHYGYMSNFYKCSFKATIDVPENNPYYNVEIEFNSSEQYFVFCKCIMFDPDNINLLNNIVNEITPSVIMSYGRRIEHFDEILWNMKKVQIMTEAIELKFTQNQKLKDKLIKTFPRRIYQASPNDKIWGIGYSIRNAPYIDRHRYGCNYLGIILEEVRGYFL